MLTDTIAGKILGFIILFGPLIWEVQNDKKGDYDKRLDLIKRGILMLIVSLVNTALNGGREITYMVKTFLLSLNMTLAIFVAAFDYWVTAKMVSFGVIELPRLGTWFTHVGKTADFDKWAPWANLSAKKRFIIRVGYLVLATVIYFIWV